MDLTLPQGFAAAAINMIVALACGALIGSERQVRQRMAGLRTNALVALGAAGFVVFSGLYPDELSPTRVAAQVVSGIGFLGAGIIFRNGFTVHGLNTAATLWCSAAVGVMAGGGAVAFAALLTGLVVFVNLGLRPLVWFLKRKTRAGEVPRQEFRVEVTMAEAEANDLRRALVERLSVPGIEISDVDLTTDAARGACHLTLIIFVEHRDDTLFKSVMTPMMIDPRISKLNWEPLDG